MHQLVEWAELSNYAYVVTQEVNELTRPTHDHEVDSTLLCLMNCLGGILN